MNKIGIMLTPVWQVVDVKINEQSNTKRKSYIIKNIYNNMEIVIGATTLQRIMNNETTFSKVFAHKISRKKSKNRYDWW